MKKICLLTIMSLWASLSLLAQTSQEPLLDPIKRDELKRDVYQLADAHFLGREAGTINEFKAAVWLVEKMREAGIQPAGDDGTYYQFFDLYFRRIMDHSSLKIGDKSLKLWEDFIPASYYPTRFEDKELVYLGKIKPEDILKKDVKGKVVAIEASLDGIMDNISLFHKRYYYLEADRYKQALYEAEVAGVIYVANSLFEDNWDAMYHEMRRGRNGVEGVRDQLVPEMPIFWVKKNALHLVASQRKMSCDLGITLYKYPSVNLVGKIEGTDAELKKEYVLFSAHHDHVGVREVVDGDSIIYGADDNASMCATLLAIARSFKQRPAKRSALFVFHGAEEMSLLGSRYHAMHPVVPKESIVCVLNGDLIGRNDINSAGLLGAWGEHRTSDELVEAALQANEEGPKFIIDKSWDDPNHPEFFFYRSDHAPYARVGIPVLFYTSLLHNEYHTPKDRADRMNYDKLKKMTDWIYLTGWKVANMKDRPKYLKSAKVN